MAGSRRGGDDFTAAAEVVAGEPTGSRSRILSGGVQSAPSEQTISGHEALPSAALSRTGCLGRQLFGLRGWARYGARLWRAESEPVSCEGHGALVHERSRSNFGGTAIRDVLPNNGLQQTPPSRSLGRRS